MSRNERFLVVLLLLIVICGLLSYLTAYNHLLTRENYELIEKKQRIEANEKIIIIFQLFYENRVIFVKQVIEEYIKYDFDVIFMIIWCNKKLLVDKYFKNKRNIILIETENNSLNNRYLLPRHYINSMNYNPTVIIHDDDIFMSEPLLTRLVQAVDEQYDQDPSNYIVSSPFIRYLTTETYDTEFPNDVFNYNMLLTVLVFKGSLINLYSLLSLDILSFIDSDIGHCDDVLFNLLLSNPHIYQTFTSETEAINQLANIESVSLQFIEPEEYSLHDFHKHSFKGNKKTDEKISSSVNRKSIRISCYKKLLSLLATHSGSQVSPLQEYKLESSFSLSNIYKESSNLEHKCTKNVFNPKFSNEYKDKRYSSVSDFKRLGVSSVFEVNFKDEEVNSFIESHSKYKELMKYKKKAKVEFEKYGRYEYSDSLCFIDDYRCRRFVLNLDFITRLKENINLNKQDIEKLNVISLNDINIKLEGVWRTNLANYNECYGNINCLFVNLGEKDIVLNVIVTSQYMPSINNLFEYKLMKLKHEMPVIDIINCAHQLDDASYHKSIVLKQHQFVLFSNELWYQIINTEQLYMICYAPLSVSHLDSLLLSNKDVENNFQHSEESCKVKLTKSSRLFDYPPVAEIEADSPVLPISSP